MEENSDTHLAKEYLKSLNIKLTPSVEHIINTISDLFHNNDRVIQTHGRYASLKIPKCSSQTLHQDENIYNIYDTFFSLSIDASLSSYLYDSFKHLKKYSSNKDVKYNFQVLKEEEMYTIYINGMQVEKLALKEKILSILQDLIRITIYENSNFLFAMHSATLEYNNKVLILPGVSGAGKSTLSSFLMHKEFNLYSDEVTSIDTNFDIQALPLCLTLKEGSWKTVDSFSKNLNALHIHHRFDGQKIKFLPPLNNTVSKISALNATIIFPMYKEYEDSKVYKLSAVEAISLFVESGYHLSNPEDIEVVKTFLEYVNSCTLYKIIYSDLNDVEQVIKGIMIDE